MPFPTERTAFLLALAALLALVVAGMTGFPGVLAFFDGVVLLFFGVDALLAPGPLTLDAERRFPEPLWPSSRTP